MNAPHFKVGDSVSCWVFAAGKRIPGTVHDIQWHHMHEEHIYVIKKEDGNTIVRMEQQIDLLDMDLTELVNL